MGHEELVDPLVRSLALVSALACKGFPPQARPLVGARGTSDVYLGWTENSCQFLYFLGISHRAPSSNTTVLIQPTVLVWLLQGWGGILCMKEDTP